MTLLLYTYTDLECRSYLKRVIHRIFIGGSTFICTSNSLLLLRGRRRSQTGVHPFNVITQIRLTLHMLSGYDMKEDVSGEEKDTY